MKTLRLTCCICGANRNFSGETVDEIIKRIDECNWTDRPNDQNTCHRKACQDKYEEALDLNPYT